MSWGGTGTSSHLLRETACSDQLQRLHLAKVRGVAEHMDEHELGDVPVSIALILVLERIAQRGRLLCDDIALLCSSLACPDRANELPAQQVTVGNTISDDCI